MNRDGIIKPGSISASGTVRAEPTEVISGINYLGPGSSAIPRHHKVTGLTLGPFHRSIDPVRITGGNGQFRTATHSFQTITIHTRYTNRCRIIEITSDHLPGKSGIGGFDHPYFIDTGIKNIEISGMSDDLLHPVVRGSTDGHIRIKDLDPGSAPIGRTKNA